MMEEEFMIRTEHLSKTFKGKKGQKIEALKDLNLEVRRGEVFGFLGPNGAGKSTTIKILMGLIYPTSGGFFIKGLNGNSSWQYKRHIGYLPENPSFYDYLTGEEYLSFTGRLFEMDQKRIEEESERLLRLLELYDARKRPIRGYSKGMIQRLGIAQALIHDPEIMILDEPMSGLDPLGRILVKDLIIDLKGRGKTIFMSTHILNDLEVLCDRVGIIVKGELKRVVEMSELMTKGIRGYTILLNSHSDRVAERLKEIKARKIDDLRFEVGKEELKGLLSLFVDDDPHINLIEPMRKGLEEFFKEIITE